MRNRGFKLNQLIWQGGKVIFTTNCAACHRADGGQIGPNLTDDKWF
jgi:mono/diheme cytochrome c family protein